MLLRLNNEKGDVRIYDLSAIPEKEAVQDFVEQTGDKKLDGSYLEFTSLKKFELAWWARTGQPSWTESQ